MTEDTIQTGDRTAERDDDRVTYSRWGATGGRAGSHTVVGPANPASADAKLKVGGDAVGGTFASDLDAVEGSTIAGVADRGHDSFHSAGEVTDWSSSGTGAITVHIDRSETRSDSEPDADERIPGTAGGIIDHQTLLGLVEQWQAGGS